MQDLIHIQSVIAACWKHQLTLNLQFALRIPFENSTIVNVVRAVMMYRSRRNWLSTDGKAHRNLAVMIGILAAILSKVGEAQGTVIPGCWRYP
jgi:hypothetical protein